MTTKDKAALLAKGEKALEWHRVLFEECLQRKDFRMLDDVRLRYDGALYMLQDLGLLSNEEAQSRSAAMFDYYLAVRFPNALPKGGQA